MQVIDAPPVTFVTESGSVPASVSPTQPQPEWRQFVEALRGDLTWFQSAEVAAEMLPMLKVISTRVLTHLSDRRSTVVKQACLVAQQLSQAIITLLMDDVYNNELSKQDVQDLLDMLCDILKLLVSKQAVTVKVISNAATHATTAVISFVGASGVCPEVHKYAVLRMLLSLSYDSHDKVRSTAFKTISLLLTLLETADLKNIRAEFVVPTTSQIMSAGKTDSTTTKAAAAALAENKTVENQGSGRPHSKSVTVCEALALALGRGVTDTDGHVREQARSCLLSFAAVDMTEAMQIVELMPGAAQTLFQEQLSKQHSKPDSEDHLDQLQDNMVSTRRRRGKKLKKNKKSTGILVPVVRRNSTGTVVASASSSDVKLIEMPTSPSRQGSRSVISAIITSPKRARMSSCASSPVSILDDEDSAARILMLSEDEEEEHLQAQDTWRKVAEILDVENPCLDKQLEEFLSTEAVCDVLTGFISRLPCPLEDIVRADDAAELSNSIKLRLEDEDEKVNVRRSYCAMQMLVGGKTKAARRMSLVLMSQCSRIVLLHMLASFHTSSKSNQYHVSKVLVEFAKKFPQTVINALSCPDGKRLLPMLLGQLHLTPMSSSMLDFISWFYKHATALCSLLNGLDFTVQVLREITSRKNKTARERTRIESYALFLKQLIRRVATTTPYLSQLLVPLYAVPRETLSPIDGNIPNKTDQVVNTDTPLQWLARVACNYTAAAATDDETVVNEVEFPLWQQSICIAIMMDLHKFSAPDTVQKTVYESMKPFCFVYLGDHYPISTVVPFVANPLLGIRGALHETLPALVAPLCACLTMERKDQLKTAKVVALCDWLVQICRTADLHHAAQQLAVGKKQTSSFTPPILNITDELVSKLVTLYFKYNDNNFVLKAVSNLLHELISKATATPEADSAQRLMKQLFVNENFAQKLLTGMISAKGHCLETFIAKLVGELQAIEHDGLKGYLAGVDDWDGFENACTAMKIFPEDVAEMKIR